MLLRLLRYPYANARSRALAAGFLKPQGVNEAAALSSREEVAAFLKPFFAVPEEEGAAVERRVRGEFQSLGEKVARALPLAGRRLVEAYLRRNEVENLKIVIRGFLQGKDVDEMRHLLLPGAKIGGISADGLQQARSLEELLQALRHPPYIRALRQGLEEPEEKRLLSIELALDRVAWEEIEVRLNDLNPTDRAEAAELMNLRADLDRFNVVHRGWRAGLAERALLKAIPPLGTAFPPIRVRRALNCGDPESSLSDLFPISIETPLSSAGEVALSRRLFLHLVRTMRSHPFDLAIPLATLMLKELESRDLQAILSGLRLGRSKKEIVPFLACVRE